MNPFVEINVDSRVSQVWVASIAEDLSSLDLDCGLLSDKLNGGAWVGQLLAVSQISKGLFARFDERHYCYSSDLSLRFTARVDSEMLRLGYFQVLSQGD